MSPNVLRPGSARGLHSVVALCRSLICNKDRLGLNCITEPSRKYVSKRGGQDSDSSTTRQTPKMLREKERSQGGSVDRLVC